MLPGRGEGEGEGENQKHEKMRKEDTVKLIRKLWFYIILYYTTPFSLQLGFQVSLYKSNFLDREFRRKAAWRSNLS
ncbi:hypothetical protein Fmac_019739 [Flemingia macrophylla]|uniref:Protein TIC 214 n=1 Tax=Flemingia macrophylla TaxID=520843 RepID=A0ABD1M8Q0_9FABA